jgi:hypothetical protein
MTTLSTPHTSPEPQHSCRAASKWAATVNDEVIPLPQRIVPAAVIKAQARVPENATLVRDHGRQGDTVIDDHEPVDLGVGNVFYTLSACEAKPHACNSAPAKLAFIVDDRAEITLVPNQTGKTLRELFGFTPAVHLLRDYESSHDEPIGLDDRVLFTDGPVFFTRRHTAVLTITVNHKKFTETDGVKHRMTGRQIASLVSENPDCTEVFRLAKGRQEPIPLNEAVEVENCDEFRVIRNNVCGGYEPARIAREILRLTEGGGRADFVAAPVAAVIYRDVPTRPEYGHLAKTDVMVCVPSGYPGAPLDGAHLPEGSPLLGRVAGSPQGIIVVEGRRWQLVSYHPHNGGGAVPWNKDRHGFHTYFDEILCWIHRANN